VQVEKTQEVLRLLERASVEHLAWLMRVHSALMFPGEVVPPSCAADTLPGELTAACGCDQEVEPMLRARGEMHGSAERVLAVASRGGRVAPPVYRAFMAAVDRYAREVRRAECHFRRRLVETDPLTGVHNRQGMMRDLRREWTRSLRTGRPCCLAIADLDHFKVVNDTWGHAAGDRVLCLAARFFQHGLRPYDLVYRFGGEEFLFCLPDTDLETARNVLDRLRGRMARLPITLDCGTRITVSCSIGVAETSPRVSVQDTIVAADRALYVAKRSGRNRIEVSALAEGCLVPATAKVGDNELRGSLRH
jgi:diguanylate cyclase